MGGARIDVMMLPNASRPGGNPFVGLLVGSLDKDIRTVPFSWKRAFLGSYDVLHAHWPEYLLEGATPMDRAVRIVLLRLLTLRMKLRRVASVVTFHNQAPHSGLGVAGVRAYRRFIATATVRVFMNQVDRSRGDYRVGDEIIPHGDYLATVKEVADLDTIASQEGRVLVFGGLRPYKGIEQLIEHAAAVPGLVIEIAGRADALSYAEKLRGLALTAPNVRLDIGELSDADLARRVRRAQFVILPYGDLYNSGAAFLALTLGRPLLLPQSPTSMELAEEFGADRVMTYQAPLTPAAIVGASSRFGASDAPVGDLGEDRAWSRIGQRYTELYRRVARPNGTSVHG